MSIVVDASFLMRALVPSQLLPAARTEFRTRMGGGEELLAPTLLDSEFASGIRALELRGRVSPAERAVVWSDFRSAPILFRWRASFVDRALEIAVETGLSKVYDAVYLACAEAYQVELLTCDASFARAVSGLSTRVRLVGPLT